MYQKSQSNVYSSCNTEWDRQNLLSIWAIFAICPLTTQKIKILKKWKKHPEISLFYTWVPTIMIIKCMLPEIWSVTDRFFLSFWLIFCPFTPARKIKISKKWKKKNAWRSLYTSAPQMKIVWYIATIYSKYLKIWAKLDKIKKKKTKKNNKLLKKKWWFPWYGAWQMEFLVILGHFLPFYLTNDQKIKILKKWKTFH